MSFRGTYTNRSRRSGGFHRAKPPFFNNDRGRPFKKNYGDRHDSSHFRNTRGGFKDHVDRRDPDPKFQLDQGRGRGRFSNRFHGQSTWSFRGRFPRRGQVYRGRSGESPTSFKRNRDNFEDESWSAEEDEMPIDDTRIWFDERAPSRLHGDYEDGEEYVGEENISLDRPRSSLSPLIIHRRFDSTELLDNHERSLERRSPTPLNASPLLQFRVDNLERENIRSKGYKRNISRSRSVTPIIEDGKKSSFDVTKRSRERSNLATRKHRKSRSLSAGSLERQRSSIERQLKYEKKRRQMLEHQKRRHEKRSESSIERFLDDCKRSFEENLRTTSSDRRSSHDKYYQRSVSYESQNFNKRSYERKSNSPSSVRHYRHSQTGNRYHHLDRHYRTCRRDKKCKKRRTSDRGLPASLHDSFERRHNYSDVHEEKINLSENFRSLDESRMSLSPISQRTLDGCRLDLSPISLEEHLGVKNRHDRTHNSYENITSLSPVSQTRSSDRLSGSYLKSTKNNADLVERRKSNDSMQEFLAELERSCERSRSSSERSFLQYENACRNYKNVGKFTNQGDLEKLNDNKHKLTSKYGGPIDPPSSKNDKIDQASNITRKIESISNVSQFSYTSMPGMSKPSHPSGLKASKISTGSDQANLIFPQLAEQHDAFQTSSVPVESLATNSQFHAGPSTHNLNPNYQQAGNVLGPNAYQSSGIMSIPFPQPMLYSSSVVIPPYFQVPLPEAPSNFTHYQNVLIIQNQNDTSGHQRPNSMNSNQHFQNIQTVGNQMYNNSIISAQNPPFAYGGGNTTDKLSIQQGIEKTVKINPNQNPRNLIVPGEAKQESVIEINPQNQVRKYQPKGVEPHNPPKGFRTLSGIPNVDQDKKMMSNEIDITNYLGKTFRDGYLTELKEVIVISDDDSDGKDNENSQQTIPNPEFIGRFKDSPLPNEELGTIFDGFVIFFGVKNNSDLEKDPFNVLQESFATSDRFGTLDVEEIPEMQDFLPVPKQVCILRWHGIMLVRASDYSREKARQKAAIMLINNLAHNCYTIQAKYSYFCGGRLPKWMLNTTEKPGEYKIVTRDEMISAVTSTLKALKERGVGDKYCLSKGIDATHIRVVVNFVDEFFKNKRRQCELIFGGKFLEFTHSELDKIIRHADSVPWLQWRSIRGRGMYTAVSRKFTPQQLYRHLLKVGGETMRYKLLPPQPPWIELLMADCQYSPNITKTLPNVKPLTDSNEPFKRSYYENDAGAERRGKWF